MRKSKTPRRYVDLAAFIEGTGQTQAYIAARVGTTQAHISRIANGDVIPRSLLAARLVKHCRIPLDSFTRVYLAKNAARVA
jgi:transcriptional regulator with XRE-family HTH domain